MDRKLMNILSLDANSNHIGWCMSTDDIYQQSGQYAPKDAKPKDANARIKDYMTWLLGLIRVENIGLVVYETPSGNNNNMNTNRVLGAVQFATWLVCNSSNVSVPMVELSPQSVKATGISKDQFGTVAKYKIFTKPVKLDGTVNQAGVDRINDEIDAIGLMVAYLRKQGKDLEPC